MQQIRGYTLHQVKEYLAASERHARRVRLGDALAARMAQADKKAWKAYVHSLEGK